MQRKWRDVQIKSVDSEHIGLHALALKGLKVLCTNYESDASVNHKDYKLLCFKPWCAFESQNADEAPHRSVTCYEIKDSFSETVKERQQFPVVVPEKQCVKAFHPRRNLLSRRDKTTQNSLKAFPTTLISSFASFIISQRPSAITVMATF